MFKSMSPLPGYLDCVEYRPGGERYGKPDEMKELCDNCGWHYGDHFINLCDTREDEGCHKSVTPTDEDYSEPEEYVIPADGIYAQKHIMFCATHGSPDPWDGLNVLNQDMCSGGISVGEGQIDRLIEILKKCKDRLKE